MFRKLFNFSFSDFFNFSINIKDNHDYFEYMEITERTLGCLDAITKDIQKVADKNNEIALNSNDLETLLTAAENTSDRSDELANKFASTSYLLAKNIKSAYELNLITKKEMDNLMKQLNTLLDNEGNAIQNVIEAHHNVMLKIHDFNNEAIKAEGEAIDAIADIVNP